MAGKQEVDDNLLISRIRNDSVEAFEVLYDRYKKKLYYFSYKYLKDHSDTEELVQAVFVSIWEHRKTLNDSLSIKNYIYRSAVNNIYNRIKKKVIHDKYVEHSIQRMDHSVNQTFDQIYYQDLKESIDSIVSTVPPQQQKIFHLIRYEDHSHKEIAEKLNLSVRTVENQIYRVIKIIKKELNI
jgi:RNA polymerase sigma-70 factor (ECF subfamily)